MAGAELVDVHRRWPVAAGNGRRESIPVSWWNQPAGQAPTVRALATLAAAQWAFWTSIRICF